MHLFAHCMNILDSDMNWTKFGFQLKFDKSFGFYHFIENLDTYKIYFFEISLYILKIWIPLCLDPGLSGWLLLLKKHLQHN